MRKFTLCMAAMVLTMLSLSVKAATITQDFNDRPSGWTDYMMHDLNAMPEGWELSGAVLGSYFQMAWPATAGIDGTPCIQYRANNGITPSSSNMSFIVTKAKKGTVTFQCKTLQALPNEAAIAAQKPYIAVYIMTPSNGTYTRGDALVEYDYTSGTLLEGVVSDWTPVTFTLPEDAYIGISGSFMLVDNYENVEAGGGGGTQMTDLYDFNNWGLSNGAGFNEANRAKMTPGLYLSGVVLTSSGNFRIMYRTGDGVDGSGCLRFQNSSYNNNNDAQRSFLVFDAKAGKIGVMVKLAASYYLENAGGYLALYKMTKNADGSFSQGEQKGTYYAPLTQISASLSASQYLPIEFNIEEDGFYAISANYLDIDNLTNTYMGSATTYTLSGKVINEELEPIAGATVSVTGLSPVTTDENGEYTIAGVPADAVTVSVSAEYYKPQQQIVTLTEDTSLNFTLEQIESTILVNAKNIISSDIVRNAHINLYDMNDNVVLEDVTINNNSQYELTLPGKLNADGYKLKATDIWYQDKECTVSVDNTSGEIHFETGKSITGLLYFTPKKVNFKATVVNESEAPMLNAEVKISYNGTEKVATNNNDGTYVITNLNAPDVADWPVTVSCTVPGMKPISTQQILFAGSDREDVQFMAIAYQPTTVKGNVTKANTENPIEGVTVTLSDGTNELGSATSDANGEYSISFTGEIPEALTLAVASPYYLPYSAQLTEVEREGVATANIALEQKMFTFKATVTDAQNVAISGAKVTISDNELSTDADGNFVASIWAKDAENDASFTAVASAPGYVAASHSFTFPAGVEEVTYNFALAEQQLTYVATVKDEEGEVIKDANVVVKSAAGDKMTVANNNDGTYTYTCGALSLPTGDFTVNVTREGYEDRHASFNFAQETEVTHTFEMKEVMYTLTVTVLNALTDKPVENATVEIVNGTKKLTATATSTPGEYEFKGGAVTYKGIELTCEISADSYEPTNFTFSFDDGNILKTVKLNEKVEGIESLFGNADGVKNIAGKVYVNGEARIFTIDGKLVRVIKTEAPEEVTGLQPGLYIVEGKKMIVK